MVEQSKQMADGDKEWNAVSEVETGRRRVDRGTEADEWSESDSVGNWSDEENRAAGITKESEYMKERTDLFCVISLLNPNFQVRCAAHTYSLECECTSCCPSQEFSALKALYIVRNIVWHHYNALVWEDTLGSCFPELGVFFPQNTTRLFSYCVSP